VLAGSLPQSLDPSLYARLITQLKGEGATVLFDTYGESLRLGIKAGPDVVFPNQAEAEMVIGHEFSSNDDFIEAAASLRQMGAASALIKSRLGCVAQISTPTGVRTILGRAPRVEALSPVGSGDAILGGYAFKLIEGAPPEECIRFALACAAANVLRPGAGVFGSEDAHGLVAGVELEEVETP
jgi:tagatose 6-phosphate kinase